MYANMHGTFWFSCNFTALYWYIGFIPNSKLRRPYFPVSSDLYDSMKIAQSSVEDSIVSIEACN